MNLHSGAARPWPSPRYAQEKHLSLSTEHHHLALSSNPPKYLKVQKLVGKRTPSGLPYHTHLSSHLVISLGYGAAAGAPTIGGSQRMSEQAIQGISGNNAAPKLKKAPTGRAIRWAALLIVTGGISLVAGFETARKTIPTPDLESGLATRGNLLAQFRSCECLFRARF